MNRNVIFRDLKRIRYKEAWDYQEKLFNQVIESKSGNGSVGNQFLLFCEHDHVYTLGKSGNKQNLLITEYLCKQKNIDYFAINRGGDITYHGPGQLVAYPIFDLSNFGMGIKTYVHLLEDIVISVLQSYGIKAAKDENAMGVWIDVDNPSKARKICAIGVRASRYVTMHGLALNINTDLSYFSHINPCGFTDKATTSMQQELGHAIHFGEVAQRLKDAFRENFKINLDDYEQLENL